MPRRPRLHVLRKDGRPADPTAGDGRVRVADATPAVTAAAAAFADGTTALVDAATAARPRRHPWDEVCDGSVWAGPVGVPLARHDVIVELLHGAAEIEHSLLVQYLYAAYSLETNPDRLDRDAPSDAINLIRMWRDSIVTIAVQEMGHLLTIQNLLHFVGGPLNFEREDFPFKSELYPFHFALRPLDRTTLAMYIVAEMPLDPSPEIFPPEVADAVAKELQEQEDCINRVGMLYERLAEHFSKLDDRVFRPESLAFQARRLDWGGDSELLVREIASRQGALDAIEEIGRQGEGFSGRDDRESHFSRFVAIFRHREFPDPAQGRGWVPTRRVATNPRTTRLVLPDNAREGLRPIDADSLSAVQIVADETLWWARLFTFDTACSCTRSTTRCAPATSPCRGTRGRGCSATS
jgi:Ferritin-like